MPIAIKMAGKEIASYDTTTDKVAIKLGDDVSINDSAGNVVLGNSGLTSNVDMSNVVFPAGHVLQVVQSNKFASVYTTSGSTQFSSSIPSITPTSSSSKLLLTWSTSIVVDTDNDTQGANNGFVRFEYQVGGTGGAWSLLEQVSVPSRGGNGALTHACQLISPATTSAVYFRLGVGKLEGGSRNIIINDDWGSNRLTMMEIAA